MSLARNINGNTDIWLMEVAQGIVERLTFDPAADVRAAWSPDGTRIMFDSNRMGRRDLYQKLASGAGDEELIVASDDNKYLGEWTPDGRMVIYHDSRGIWSLPLEGDRQPSLVVGPGAEEAKLSPDGKWLAYESRDGGRQEIYVQPLNGVGGKRQVSGNGGTDIRWRGDGRELFYNDLEGRLIAVPVQFDATGQSISFGSPVPLFTNPSTDYQPSHDGRRFLVDAPFQTVSTPPITVILNWRPQ